MWPRARLSISIAGWPERSVAPGESPRTRIERVAAWGARGAQLDATMAGIRPRELDRSGRRDLAALLKRLGLSFSGLDLFIPLEHFTNARHTDRALSAASAACELASDLERLAGDAGAGVVCTALPDSIDPRVIEALAAAADRHGVAIADLAWPPRDQPAGPGIGAGFDPAAMLMRGADPAAEVARLHAPVLAARLSDVSAVGRVAPGSPGGRLDVLGYAAALHARGFAGAVVADLRGLDDADKAAARMIAAWGP